MNRRSPFLRGGALLSLVAASPLTLAAPPQDDEFDFEDDLEALLDGELVEESGPEESIVRGVQGFVALLSTNGWSSAVHSNERIQSSRPPRPHLDLLGQQLVRQVLTVA